MFDLLEDSSTYVVLQSDCTKRFQTRNNKLMVDELVKAGVIPAESTSTLKC